MSELKVNTITGLGGQITITDPVAIGGSAQSGYELTVAGKTKTSQSIDVVTVAAEDFGVRIRAPFSSGTNPGLGDSTIQFTSNSGTEYASIHAKNTNSLVIKTNGAERVTIDSIGTVTHAYKTVLVGDTTVNGLATFSPFVPVCTILPAQPSQLTNKAYVDAQIALLNSQLSKYMLLETPISVGNGTNIYNAGVPRTARLIHVQYTVDTGHGPRWQTASMTINGQVRANRTVGMVHAHGDDDGTGTMQYFTMPTVKYYYPTDTTSSAILNFDYGSGDSYGYMQITGYTT